MRLSAGGIGTVLLLIATVTGASAWANEAERSAILGTVSLTNVVPVPCDWDGDGGMDLLIGTVDGEIIIIELLDGLYNFEVTTAHRLALMNERGETSDLRLSGAHPEIAARFSVHDWNGDGQLDVIALDSNLELNVFLGMFDAPYAVSEPVTPTFLDGHPVSMPLCPDFSDNGSVTIVDWNSDSVFDLLIAVGEPYVLLGAPAEETPVFVRPREWTWQGWCGASATREEIELFGLSGYAVLAWAVDWNRDGRNDIVLGYAANTDDRAFGRVLFVRGRGAPANPTYIDSQTPCDEMYLLNRSGQPIRKGRYATVAPCDANADGYLDLLVGGDGPLSLYIGDRTSTLTEVWTLSSVVLDEP